MATATEMEVEEEQQVVNPWEVSAGKGGIDYDKLVDQFGCQRIDAALVDRVARLTARPPHQFLRRGLFFAHRYGAKGEKILAFDCLFRVRGGGCADGFRCRDLTDLLDLYEKGEKFYLYTGRGPSSEALHLGHLIPFMFTKYVQAVLDSLVYALSNIGLICLEDGQCRGI
jgi:tryptophanyl-tRNA synthetase